MQPSHAIPSACAVGELQGLCRRRFWLVWACLLAVVLAVAEPHNVYAQVPHSFRIPRLLPEDVESAEEPADAQAAGMQKIIVDTDPGVDDAAALIWLLSQSRYSIRPLGIVTVAGNTTVENATTNTLVILSWLNRKNIPVVKGAAAPLAVNHSSTGKLIHGPDGLWYLGWTYAPSIGSPDPRSAEVFYCETLRGQEAEVIVMTYGPVTNIARAMLVDPATCGVNWGLVRIVSLGGAKIGGNQTPVTEYNIWQDPDAANVVLNSGAPWTLVTLDGFSQFTLDNAMFRVLQNTGVPAMRTLLPALQSYAAVLSGAGGKAALPDPVAAMVALDSHLGRGAPGLVRILGSDVPEFVRGQTVIALDMAAEWPALAATDAELSAIANTVFADPFNPDFGYMQAAVGAIIMANPPNATVVTDIEARHMRTIFMRGVTGAPGKTKGAAEDSDMTGQAEGTQEHHLYLPGVIVSPSGE